MTGHFLLFNSCFCRFRSHLVCRSLEKELCIFSYLWKISCCQEEAAKILPCIFFGQNNVLFLKMLLMVLLYEIFEFSSDPVNNSYFDMIKLKCLITRSNNIFFHIDCYMQMKVSEYVSFCFCT